MTPPEPALVLVDHGTRRSEANRSLEQVAALVRAAAPGRSVRCAHMELAPPSLAEAIAACAAEGAGEIVVVPYFLAPGSHSTRDIPRLAEEAAARHPGLRVRVAEPLGADPLLARLVLERAQEARAPGDAPDPARGRTAGDRRLLWPDNPLRTRGDAQRAAAELLDAWAPHLERGGARPRLGFSGALFDAAAEALEGVARPLWAAAPLAAGGFDWPHWALVRRALAEGTDPAHPRFWGRAGDGDQRLVEMAAIGFALALVPEHVWDPLAPHERARLAAWLGEIDRAEPHANNWQLFRVLVQLGLHRVGAAYDPGAGERSFSIVEGHAEDGGWYRDGDDSNTVDHYVAWAYHTYGLLYASFAGDRDPDRAAVLRARARAFAPEFAAWFDPTGGVLPYGRSLTYRFAANAFWGALAVAGEEALPWPVIRGLWARHLRWWRGRPVLDASGLPALGWTYPNLSMVEGYSSPASPGWACKAFLPLALGPEHPFWRADEAPHPGVGAPRAQPAPRLVVSGDAHQVQALAGGRGVWYVREGAAKYGRFAYSSAFGFALEGDPTLAPHSDSMLRLVLPSLRSAIRRAVLDSGIEGDLVWSRWSPLEGVEVTTVLAGRCPWHVRLHRVRSEHPLLAIETGFALGWRGGDPAEPAVVREVGPGCAEARSEHGRSRIVDLGEGAATPRAGRVVTIAPNTSITWPRALLPRLDGALPAGEHSLACAVLGQPGGAPALAGPEAGARGDAEDLRTAPDDALRDRLPEMRDLLERA